MKIDAAPASCRRCGRVFAPGQTRYLVTISLVADFDGTLGSAGGAGELEEVLRRAELLSEEELMNGVLQRLAFTLCKPCRDEWAKAPLGAGPDWSP